MSRQAAAAAVVAFAAVTGMVAAQPAEATMTGTNDRIYLGANGDRAGLEQKIANPLSAHAYTTWSAKVPTGQRLITVNSGDSWATVANAKSGSALHAHIVRWAKELKAQRTTVMLAYQHEPETGGNTRKGSAADFIRAYRNVVTIIRSQGATNVKFTWQMTAWSFRAPSTSATNANRWYPGDAYVDIVGADAYNWYNCGEGTSQWRELSFLVAPVLTFGKAHGKQIALPEFGSHRDARRATWLTNAKNYLAANKSHVAAAYYFHRPPTNAANSDCVWPLTTSAEFSAFKSMATNGAFIN